MTTDSRRLAGFFSFLRQLQAGLRFEPNPTALIALKEVTCADVLPLKHDSIEVNRLGPDRLGCAFEQTCLQIEGEAEVARTQIDYPVAGREDDSIRQCLSEAATIQHKLAILEVEHPLSGGGPDI